MLHQREPPGQALFAIQGVGDAAGCPGGDTVPVLLALHRSASTARPQAVRLRPACIWTQGMTAERFVELFEGPKRPAVLAGVVDQWPAAGRWTPEQLRARFGEHRFKVGGPLRPAGGAARVVACWALCMGGMVGRGGAGPGGTPTPVWGRGRVAAGCTGALPPLACTLGHSRLRR
jgi:hypothetical protein